MDSSLSSETSKQRNRGVTPKKSPTAENVARRRKDIDKSEWAAYWASLNLSIAVLLYFDLYYMELFEGSIFVYVEWILCALFATSASYDLMLHFWPHTVMTPIVVTPHDKILLGIQDDELGFKIDSSKPVEYESFHDSLPPFELWTTSNPSISSAEAGKA